MKPLYEINTVKTHDDYGTLIVYFRYPSRLPEVQWMVVEEVKHKHTTTYKHSGQVVRSSSSEFFKLGDTVYQEGDRSVGISSVSGVIIGLNPEQLEITISTTSGREETLLYGELPIMTQRDLLIEENFENDRYSDYLLDMIDDFAEDLRKVFFAGVDTHISADILGEMEGLLDRMEAEVETQRYSI